MNHKSWIWEGTGVMKWREKIIQTKAYLYVYKTQIQKCLAYRFDVYGNIVMQCIIMFATAFFWKALYAEADVVQGVDVRSMLVYTVISSMMSVLLTTNVEHRVIQSVEKGTVATDMLRPIILFGIYFFEDLGAVTALLFQNMIPIFLIGSICIALPRPAGISAFLGFLASLLMAFLINWLLAGCFSMWAFSAINMNPMVQVKKHLIRLLSGSIIPMWFFPEWLSNILNVLPFVYIYQLPLDLYIGKCKVVDAIPRLAIQLGWVCILSVLFCFLQKRVTRRVLVQGG